MATKEKLLALFEKSPTKCAKALGVHRQTIWEWPEELPEPALLRVRNWFLREHGHVPKVWMPK